MIGTSPIHVLLAGGGSGGHVFPALAVGEELTRRGCRVSFAGSADGMEARLVPDRGLEFHALRSRRLVGRGSLGKAAALATLGLSALSGALLVRRLGAAAILGTGGFASAPGVVGGWLARRPVLLLEPNARSGVANRQLARFAAGAAVAFPRTAEELSCPARTTGVPVRRAFFEVEGGLPEAAAPRLLVLGGSQGARTVNLALVRALGEPHRLFDRLATSGAGGPRILHQTGARQLEEVRRAYREAGLEDALAAGSDRGRIRLAEFVDDVAGAMARSHLVISRAGAITVAEIAAAGRPSVLVPLPLAGGHQVDNARAFEEAGAARVVEQAGAGPEAVEELAAGLAGVLEELLSGPPPGGSPADRLEGTPGERGLTGSEELRRMARAARSLARPGAAAAIADWLEELAAPVRRAGRSRDGGERASGGERA